MKTVINSSENVISETIQRIWDSFQLLMAVVLIPILFIVGISHDNGKATYGNDININKPGQATNLKATVNFSRILPDQNS